ncbi:helix-turn-helix domain-containing protein [Roseobacteraceae bacterium NS-SX3]
MTDSSHIRNYNLFGETAELADVLHVETIRSRSEPHDWELKPHRHARLHQLLFLTAGGGRAGIDGRDLALQPPCFVNIPRNAVHSYRFEPGTGGWVVTLPVDLLDHCLVAGEGVRAPLERAHVLPLPASMRSLAEHLFTEYHRKDFARAQVLRALAGALTGLAARAIQSAEGAEAGDPASPLFHRFERMVERDFKSRRPLADYARELAVSPTHLNRIVHQAAGQSASQLLNERVLREARRMLIYTNLTAAQIAYELGFTDPAHFSRVFAKGTGLPPRAFRQRGAGAAS